ncbi:MAG: alpha/beta hydrolase [Burkholderiaceae bacterium]|nr:alpha/beta hydrolase [Burkholderiaceae bacterium]
MTRPPLSLVLIAALAAAALLAACRPGGGARADGLEPCRLPGIEREILCGSVAVPEDPDQPAGRRIEVRFAVVPAVARNKQPDPVFVLAGGPGQAATRVIGLTLPFLAELNARRDLVYVDQRGTGGSSPLDCPDDDASLAATLDPAQQLDQLRRCLRELKSDTRQFATWIAVGDLEAVRMKLGADRINLWGGSYGTRVALEFLRQFPHRPTWRCRPPSRSTPTPRSPRSPQPAATTPAAARAIRTSPNASRRCWHAPRPASTSRWRTR